MLLLSLLLLFLIASGWHKQRDFRGYYEAYVKRILHLNKLSSGKLREAFPCLSTESQTESSWKLFNRWRITLDDSWLEEGKKKKLEATLDVRERGMKKSKRSQQRMSC